MEYGLIFHGTRTGKYYCKNMKYRINRYICLWTKKKTESYFNNRLTFSNIRSRTSREIYRLALALLSLETLSSLSELKISLFNAHLARFV